MKKQFEEQYRAFGLNVKRYRYTNNYTQLQIAGMLGITLEHLGRIENGKVGASLDIVFALAEIFKISPQKLFKELD